MSNPLDVNSITDHNGYENPEKADVAEFHQCFEHFDFPDALRDISDESNRNKLKNRLRKMDPSYRGGRLAQIIDCAAKGLYSSLTPFANKPAYA